jgi:NTP pyrophosphatase (non-canonical NTP hydrolase)
MMTKEQFRLFKLAEEASEAAQAAAKQAVFGPDKEYKGKRNRDNLREEIMDFMMVARLLVWMGQVDPITEADLQAQYRAKHQRIVDATTDVVARGMIEPDLMNSIPETLP